MLTSVIHLLKSFAIKTAFKTVQSHYFVHVLGKGKHFLDVNKQGQNYSCIGYFFSGIHSFRVFGLNCRIANALRCCVYLFWSEKQINIFFQLCTLF